MCCKYKIDNPEQKTFLVENLQPQSSYEYRVAPYTRVGEGPDEPFKRVETPDEHCESVPAGMGSWQWPSRKGANYLRFLKALRRSKWTNHKMLSSSSCSLPAHPHPSTHHPVPLAHPAPVLLEKPMVSEEGLANHGNREQSRKPFRVLKRKRLSENIRLQHKENNNHWN